MLMQSQNSDPRQGFLVKCLWEVRLDDLKGLFKFSNLSQGAHTHLGLYNLHVPQCFWHVTDVNLF